jgi:magnesium transporter
VEDIVNTTQRPKMDVFDDYLYLVLRMHMYEEATGAILSEQVSFILGKNFLLTFQERPGDSFDSVRTRIRNNKGKVRKMGPDYLAYALIDSVIDSFFAVLERTGEEIEDIEEELITEPSSQTMQKIHVLKREMILMRKAVWPMREVISALQRDETPLVSDELSVFLKDLYDHTIQIIDTVETFRDVISGMLDIYLSSISNRMNEVMKVLTIFAALFIPLTFIAGIYGMNFNPAASPYNMPELNWFYGYPFALFLMVSTVIGLLFFFRRKRWI